MREIELIEKMTLNKRVKRSERLITPIMLDSLKTECWAFPLSYGFRDALDIRFTEKVTTIKKVINGEEVKVQKKHMLWTQGRVIAFKDGDFIINSVRDAAVQVEFAQPMGWDNLKDIMYNGSVIFKLYNIQSGKYFLSGKHECDQLAFLAFLITGELKKTNEISY